MIVLVSAAMRTVIAILVLGLGLAACSKGENAGAEEAKKQAEEELQQKVKEPNAVAKKIDPPVAGRAKLDCEALIDTDKFTQLLGETDAGDGDRRRRSEPEAAASCSILRGGKRLTEAEQKARSRRKAGSA